MATEEEVAMKKFLLALGLVVLMAVSAQAITMTVTPGAVTAASGSYFTAVVTIADSPAVEACDLIFTFDPALNAVRPGTFWFGDFMGQQMYNVNDGYNSPPFGGGESAVGPFVAYDNVLGIASYTVAGAGSIHSSGSGTVASVTFRSKTNAAYGIWFDVSMVDPDMIRVGQTTGYIAVNGWVPPTQPPAGVPEPMTLALVAGALAGLGVFARKRS